MQIEKQNTGYQQLVSKISDAFTRGQKQAALAVNGHLVMTYWQVGQYIVEYEQKGSDRAVYGNKLLENLSKDLCLLHGKGFGVSNIYRMRQFYIAFPILAELPQKLSWIHCVELLKIEDPLERSFYLHQTINFIFRIKKN
ncbi:MAG: DUF1016 N-terminal domain-containing protein [Dysgonamonadaceae bacterium]|jgi:hypothetical protein|nr:DUF1016 N-terminal domain-containing protein [Dysgonamonadaceae bacterium]